MAEPSGSKELPDWIKNHLARYIATDGEDGYLWDALPLIFGASGPDYVVVASKGGAPEHPAWYLNLEANPTVKVQVKADKFTARAHTANAQERAALWSRMVEIYGPYTDYQQKTDRQIPVVVLKRA